MICVYKCEGCKFTKNYEQSETCKIVRICLQCNKEMSYQKEGRPPFLTYKAVFKRNRKERDYGL